MQFLKNITHPLAVGAAVETPVEAAAIRRGAHWVALPDEHDLIAPLARLVSARDGHRVVPYHIVVSLVSRVLRLPAVVDGALAAVAVLALGSPSLEYMEGILGHVKAEPYSLFFDGMDAASLLRVFKQLSSHDRLSVDPRLWSASRAFFSLQFEPLILVLPAAGAAAAIETFSRPYLLRHYGLFAKKRRPYNYGRPYLYASIERIFYVITVLLKVFNRSGQRSAHG